jgi:hypothetical protein
MRLPGSCLTTHEILILEITGSVSFNASFTFSRGAGFQTRRGTAQQKPGQNDCGLHANQHHTTFWLLCRAQSVCGDVCEARIAAPESRRHMMREF